MPELPEVESVRRVIERALKGKKIKTAEAVTDDIVHERPILDIQRALEGAVVKGAGRKGKIWWIELDRTPWLFGHLGMSGWVRELEKPTVRLREHGKQPLDDEAGRPRFLKLLIEAEDGTRVALTDGRRLGRVWLSDSPAVDPRVTELGFDCLHDLPAAPEVAKILSKRKAPVKAVLMDQGVFAGIGNWVADEVLYQSRIAPKRLANSLTLAEVKKLRAAIAEVLQTAVEAGADSDKYPESWLFHHRWGGDRGSDQINGKKIVREPVGGRTTAWVPGWQK